MTENHNEDQNSNNSGFYRPGDFSKPDYTPITGIQIPLRSGLDEADKTVDTVQPETQPEPKKQVIPLPDSGRTEARRWKSVKKHRPTRSFEEEVERLSKEGKIKIFPDIRKYIGIFFVIAGGVLLLLMIAQALPYFFMVSLLPPWQQLIYYTILCIVLLVILASGCFIYRRIKRSFVLDGSIDVTILSRLAESKIWQKEVTEKFVQAQNDLQKYMNFYAVSDDTTASSENDNKKSRNAIGRALIYDSLLSKEQFDEIQSEIEKLNKRSGLEAKDWITEFQNGFQDKLDKAAVNIVVKYSRQTGFYTAISPKAMADRVIVLVMSLSMVKDLLTLYKVRPSWWETIVVFGRTVFNTYVGGKSQWLAEQAVDSLADSGLWEMITSSNPVTNNPDSPSGDGVDSADSEAPDADNQEAMADLCGLSGVVFSVGKHVLKVTAEGVANAFLIKRLGINLIQNLQPTQRKLK